MTFFIALAALVTASSAYLVRQFLARALADEEPVACEGPDQEPGELKAA
ncbi:MAG TPA: hypothetical protein VFC53_11565 [Dehalococcoidia bacterium]|jgi:hypothetical protein|nr:hypothetical protein [Dehalococcoidia bacterium]